MGGIPNQSGLDFYPEGFHQGNDDGGDNTAGETGIVEGIAHVSVLGVEGNGNQNITDDKTHSKRQKKLQDIRNIGNQQNLGDNRRKGGTAKPDMKIFSEGNPVNFGIKGIAQNYCPDI